jgi:hypothetical protein
MSQQPLILGIAGRARHGKDTIAAWLCAKHGFTRLAYADSLRDMLELGLGIEPRYLTDDKETVIPWLGVTGRHLMQSLGTEWGRQHIRADLWVIAIQQRIERLADDADRIVISDVRFTNEADWIRSHTRGHLWHVYRPGYLQEGMQHSHPSEAGIKPIRDEPTLINTTLDNLHRAIDIEIDALLEIDGYNYQPPRPPSAPITAHLEH